MEIFNSPKEIPYKHTSIALGSFDGVHLAHKKVIEKAKEIAKKHDYKSGVLLFKSHIKPTKYIFSLEENIAFIKEIDIDFVLLCDFDNDFKTKTPLEFIKYLKEEINAKAMTAGFNYRFGYKAIGDAGLLKELGKSFDIGVEILPELMLNNIIISTTEIRNMLKERNLKAVSQLLGRKYSISGTVKKGRQNGRKLGFRTANLIVDDNRAILPDGVYSGSVLYNKNIYKSIINIGKNPTFNADNRTIEAHLIDFNEDLYNKDITITFEEFIREEKKFNNYDELKEQICKDINFTLNR